MINNKSETARNYEKIINLSINSRCIITLQEKLLKHYRGEYRIIKPKCLGKNFKLKEKALTIQNSKNCHQQINKDLKKNVTCLLFFLWEEANDFSISCLPQPNSQHHRNL